MATQTSFPMDLFKFLKATNVLTEEMKDILYNDISEKYGELSDKKILDVQLKFSEEKRFVTRGEWDLTSIFFDEEKYKSYTGYSEFSMIRNIIYNYIYWGKKHSYEVHYYLFDELRDSLYYSLEKFKILTFFIMGLKFGL